MKKNTLSKEQLKDLKWSESEYDKIHKNKGFYEENEYYEVLAMLLKGKKAVDIGCGEGYIEYFNPDITAVDFSAEALKRAKKNGAKYVVKAPAEDLPFRDNSFDIAVSAGTLEHLVDRQRGVEEMARIAKVQILTVHAKLPWLYQLMYRIMAIVRGWKEQPFERPLSLRELNGMLAKAGLKVIFQGVFNYIDPRWIWKKLPYGIIKIPSHYFIVSIRSKSKRKFLEQ